MGCRFHSKTRTPSSNLPQIHLDGLGMRCAKVEPPGEGRQVRGVIVGFPFSDHYIFCISHIGATPNRALIENAHSMIPPQRLRVFPLFLRSVTLGRALIVYPSLPKRTRARSMLLAVSATAPHVMWRLCSSPINRSTAKHVRKKSVSSSQSVALSNRSSPLLAAPEIDFNVTGGMVTDPLHPSIPPHRGMQEEP